LAQLARKAVTASSLRPKDMNPPSPITPRGLDQRIKQSRETRETRVKNLHSGRSIYQCKAPPHKKGWNSMTTVHFRSFDGRQPRPYNFQTCGTPRATAESGMRSVHDWQRDYNTKGATDQQFQTLRQERIRKLRQEALKEARFRGVPVEQVEIEMAEMRMAQIRVPSHIMRKQVEVQNAGDVDLLTRIQEKDGSIRLETNFDLFGAREMFRRAEWNEMERTLNDVNEKNWPNSPKPKQAGRTKTGAIDDDPSFRPPPRNSKGSQPTSPSAGSVKGLARGSFSGGISAAALAQQLNR